MNKIGAIIKQERNKRKWTTRKLAEYAKVSPAVICQIEKGNIKHPTMATLESLEEVLQVPLKNIVYKEPINTELTLDQKVTICLTEAGFNVDQIKFILEQVHFIEWKRNNEPRR